MRKYDRQQQPWSQAGSGRPLSQTPQIARPISSELKKIRGYFELYKVRREQRLQDEIGKNFSREGLYSAVVLNLATGYTSMYATRMGANPSQIGLLASIPQFIAMLTLIPGSLLAGRFHDRRRPVEIFTLLYGFFYGMGFLAPWAGAYKVLFLTLCIALANSALNIYNSSWQSYFSEVVPFSRRNQVYSARTSSTFITGTLVLFISGLVLGTAGNDRTRIFLYQCCYLISFIFAILQKRTLRQLPSSIGSATNSRVGDILTSVKLIFASRSFLRFAAVSLIFHAGWYMAWPLFFLNQVHYCGANESWIGYISVSGTLLQAALISFWGRYIEKHDMGKALLWGLAGLSTNPFLSALAGYLPGLAKLPALLVFNLLGCAGNAAFQLAFLQLLLLEIPREKQHLNLAIFNTSLLAANSLMQMLGVSIYNALGATQNAMLVSFCIAGSLRLVGLFFFFMTWKKQKSGAVPEQSA